MERSQKYPSFTTYDQQELSDTDLMRSKLKCSRLASLTHLKLLFVQSIQPSERSVFYMAGARLQMPHENDVPCIPERISMRLFFSFPLSSVMDRRTELVPFRAKEACLKAPTDCKMHRSVQAQTENLLNILPRDED